MLVRCPQQHGLRLLRHGEACCFENGHDDGRHLGKAFRRPKTQFLHRRRRACPKLPSVHMLAGPSLPQPRAPQGASSRCTKSRSISGSSLTRTSTACVTAARKTLKRIDDSALELCFSAIVCRFLGCASSVGLGLGLAVINNIFWFRRPPRCPCLRRHDGFANSVFE